jgi:hypothetical protein
MKVFVVDTVQYHLPRLYEPCCSIQNTSGHLRSLTSMGPRDNIYRGVESGYNELRGGVNALSLSPKRLL